MNIDSKRAVIMPPIIGAAMRCMEAELVEAFALSATLSYPARDRPGIPLASMVFEIGIRSLGLARLAGRCSGLAWAPAMPPLPHPPRGRGRS